MSEFEGRVAVITGGGHGIGKAAAEAFRRENAVVYVMDITPGASFCGDVGRREDLEAFAQQVKRVSGRVDFLINNVPPPMKGLENCSYEEFQRALAIGVTAPFYLTQLFLPVFAEHASVINLSSSRDRMSQPGTESYTAAKGGIAALTHAMAVTLSGALIGYTETVTDTQATVRTIIDSEASIAALIQSSRDQGTIRGTLGIDGTPMCRMYYLPDDHLPRPGDVVVTSGVSMSFPKGIPIGTVRESTRGMDANKQYIIVEPTADFQHIEYVNVMRYKPAAGAIQNNISSTKIELVPLETARPYPTIRIGSLNYFATDVPEGYTETEETPAPSPSAAPSVSPSPSPSPTPADLPVPPEDDFGYVVVTTHDPNITPSPSPSPTPTPYITLGPDNTTLEDD